MDPFELLKKDHKTVSELFERIEAATGKAKLGIFQQIKDELELHTHIEEVIFYPALEKANETRDLTLEAYEEHKVVKDLLGELDSAKAVSDEWEARLTVLKENVEHHVDEEEHELFDKANDVLTADEAETLGDRMQAEKVKRGGAVAQPNEEPGLLRKIASALAVGTSSRKPTKVSSGRKPAAKKAAKKKAPKKTGAKKIGKPSTKSSVSKLSKSTKAASTRKRPRAGKRKQAAAKSSSSRARSSGKGTAAKKKGKTAKTGRRKQSAAKKGTTGKAARG